MKQLGNLLTRITQKTKDKTIGPTSQSLQHGWNIKQTRHDPTICWLGYRDTWENLQGTIHRTRTTEDYCRIPLVDQDESNNRLAEGNPFKVGCRKLIKCTYAKKLQNSLPSLSWSGADNFNFGWRSTAITLKLIQVGWSWNLQWPGLASDSVCYCYFILLRVPFMEVVLIWNGDMAGSVTVPAPANAVVLCLGSWHCLG